MRIPMVAWLGLPFFVVVYGLSIANNSHYPSCRCMPQDPCWPEEKIWARFNSTLAGKLIATVPIASICHNDPFTTYNKAQCDQLRSNWGFPETHYGSSSSIMASRFTNLSCNPFTLPDTPCTIGNYVEHTVNATNAADVQRTIRFADRYNIRLVIRNTGHDLLGKSTGAGALAIWTHYIKDISILDYNSSHYTGKAIKVGAGVQTFESNAAVYNNGLVIVGGNCPTVGIAGGYSQGGGHGQLVSKFGLAADQVLEWEVVLANGELVRASRSNHHDLYWALSGGGGGTFGVVISMTSKAYPELATVSGNISFSDTGTSRDTFFTAVSMFISILPSIGDAGGASVWWLTNNSLSTTPTTIPGGTAAALKSFWGPLISFLEQNNMEYTNYVDDFPTYHDAYGAMSPPQNITDQLLGGRLIQRTVVDHSLPVLVSTLRNIVEDNHGFIVSGITVNSSRAGYPSNAVNPAWREAVISLLVGIVFDYTDAGRNTLEERLITDVLVPHLEVLTIGSGAYLNEADPNQPNWQQLFYGDKYGRLLEIKQKYDPRSIFYANTAVGSEVWVVSVDGRLCRSQDTY